MLQIKIFDLDLKNPEAYETSINEWLSGLGDDVELVETKFTPYTWRDDEGKSAYMLATFIVKVKPTSPTT